VTDLPLAIHSLIFACRNAGMEAPVAILLKDESQRLLMVAALVQSGVCLRYPTVEEMSWDMELMGVRISVAA
jgi:hypothetical protein